MKKPRKPVNRVSASRKIQNAEYEKLKREWNKKAINWRCRIEGCTTPADKTPHHMYGRRGKLLNDVRFWIPVCNFHHSLIHNQPAWARENGLLALVGQWNNPQP